MPLLFQRIIVRSDLHANRSALYLFGDNELRKGLGGQAKEMRGEPNAVGIRTKRAPSMADGDLWSDLEYERCAHMIADDFQRAFRHVEKGGTVVVPTDGLGTGYARLPEVAPRVYQKIVESIGRLIVTADHIAYPL